LEYLRLWRFGIFYDHLVHFVFIWCIFPVLVSSTKKNLATLFQIPKLIRGPMFSHFILLSTVMQWRFSVAVKVPEKSLSIALYVIIVWLTLRVTRYGFFNRPKMYLKRGFDTTTYYITFTVVIRS
jgi:hypothetical protein